MGDVEKKKEAIGGSGSRKSESGDQLYLVNRMCSPDLISKKSVESKKRGSKGGI